MRSFGCAPRGGTNTPVGVLFDACSQVPVGLFLLRHSLVYLDLGGNPQLRSLAVVDGGGARRAIARDLPALRALVVDGCGLASGDGGDGAARPGGARDDDLSELAARGLEQVARAVSIGVVKDLGKRQDCVHMYTWPAVSSWWGIIHETRAS